MVRIIKDIGVNAMRLQRRLKYRGFTLVSTLMLRYVSVFFDVVVTKPSALHFKLWVAQRIRNISYVESLYIYIYIIEEIYAVSFFLPDGKPDRRRFIEFSEHVSLQWRSYGLDTF